MVNNEGILNEDDKSEKDDDDESDTKHTRRAPRHVPLPGVAEKKEAERPQPRISLSDKLFEKMGAKKEASKVESALDTDQAEKVEKPKEKLEPEVRSDLIDPSHDVLKDIDKTWDEAVINEISLESDATKPDSKEKDESAHHKGKHDKKEKSAPEHFVEMPTSESEHVEFEALDNSEESLAAADWEAEGELDDEGEIRLERPSAAEAAPAANEDAGFVERPAEPMDTREEPAVEIGEVEPELLESGLESEEPVTPEGPPVPPEVPPVASMEAEPDEPDEPFVPPHTFTATGGGAATGAESPWYDAVAAEKARQTEIEDAEYYAEKRGLRKGLGAGLFFGWMFGRHGKKKAAAEHTKELKSKDKEIKDLNNNQIAAQTRMDTFKGTLDTLQSRVTENSVAAPRSSENSPQVQIAAAESIAKPKDSVQERLLNKEIPVFFERPQKTREAFEGTAFARNTEKQPGKQPERTPEGQEITEETYIAPDGRRVETSAWHRIEVDEKTGKVINNPEVAYGREFQRERRQEVMRDDDNIQTGGGGSGGPVVAASQLGSIATSDLAQASVTETRSDHSLPPVLLKDSEKTDPHHVQLTAGAEMLRYASMPSIWIVAVLIVVVLFIFGALR